MTLKVFQCRDAFGFTLEQGNTCVKSLALRIENYY